MIDPRGNVSGGTPANYTVTYTYDPAGNQTQVANQLGQATVSTFNRTGQVDTVTDPRGTVTTYTYDSVDRLKTVGTTVQGVTTYNYNTTGRLTSRVDALTHSTGYEYDLAGRLTKQTDPLGRFWTHVYDKAGNRTKTVNAVANAVVNPLLGTTDYSFDRLGRRTLVNYSDTTPDVTTSYDTRGRMLTVVDGSGTETVTYDLLSRVSAMSGGGNGTSAYAYDPNANITSRTLADGTVVTYGYDDDNRLTGVTVGATTTSYTYDAAGNPLTTALPNTVTKTVTYDRAGRIATLGSTQGVNPIASYTYTRDNAGNPTQIVATGTNVAGTRVFTYDPVSRLTDVCYTTGVCPAGQKTSWTYNQVGSRLTQTDAGVASAYNYDVADQLTSITGVGAAAYTYDANGNQTVAGTRVSTYNAAMQTMSIKDGAAPATTYTYDSTGNRLTATNNAVVSRFQWDRNSGLPTLAIERDTANTVTRRYVNGLEPISLTAGGATSYYLTDELGSTTHLTHGTTGATQWAHTYSPYGTDKTATKVDPAAPNNPLKYTGQYQDPTNLYNLRARLYNPTLGTFTQTDPTPRGAGSPFESSYVYGNSRPEVVVDPSGMRGVLLMGGNVISGLNPCGGNQGENLVRKHKTLLKSMSMSFGFSARVPALILLDENNFNTCSGYVADLTEQMDPFGDTRTGVSNLHSWDLEYAIGRNIFSLDQIQDFLEPDLTIAASARLIGGVPPSDTVKSKIHQQFRANHKVAFKWSVSNDELNIRLLLVNLGATARGLRKYANRGPLGFEDALVLSRKTGSEAAVWLYAGNIGEYSRWLAGPPYSGDGRLAATLSTPPSWLAHYRKYNPDAFLS